MQAEVSERALIHLLHAIHNRKVECTLSQRLIDELEAPPAASFSQGINVTFASAGARTTRLDQQ
jgi:hypothetical protein